MGSWSQSVSNTNYSNTPLSLQDNENGVALAGNRDTLLGGSNNVAGSSNLGNQTLATRNGAISVTSLDGGAIQLAFDSTDRSVAAIADLTARIVSNAAAQNTAALGFTEKANAAALVAATPAATAEKQTNYTLIAAVGLVVVYLVMRGAK